MKGEKFDQSLQETISEMGYEELWWRKERIQIEAEKEKKEWRSKCRDENWNCSFSPRRKGTRFDQILVPALNSITFIVWLLYLHLIPFFLSLFKFLINPFPSFFFSRNYYKLAEIGKILQFLFSLVKIIL